MDIQSVWQWFVAPLQYEFMVKAVIVSAMVGLVCAVLSCYMTLKGWALMGDAVSHAVMKSCRCSRAAPLAASVSWYSRMKEGRRAPPSFINSPGMRKQLKEWRSIAAAFP